MTIYRTWTASKTLLGLASVCLAIRCGLEWLVSRYALIESPLVLVAYIASFLACLIVATVLWVHSAHWLSGARILALLLLLSLLWSLF
ncbi:hypothetical protein [Cohnella zeiphila]|uniref:Uncharacterized protein n=1 Tax=Cohnella zeiphila TaxID=2761120 RepID=A0A7X0SQL7_9BACL|nr:hypothetical protein [Cohnella zeiphila]MBB6734266.1 hypothetical protein [Cohnella zeiphila]